MGYLLYREVRDFAPADLSQAELVVALMIADDANEHTRRSWIALELLCARARLKPTGVRGALQRLAARGLEFRVIHGYGKDGRPVFAAKGHAVDYLVPDMLKGDTLTSPYPVDNPPKGDTTVSPSDRQRRHENEQRRHDGVGFEPQRRHDGVAPLLKDLKPHISSTTTVPVDDAPVEGARARPDQDHELRRPTHPEIAAWQAAQSRKERMNGAHSG